jgi:hypothetical protein
MRSAPSSTAWEIGVLLTTPPSISRRSPIATGGKIPGIDADAAMASLDQVERDQMERNSRIGEVLKLDVPSDQSPQLAIRHEVIAPAAHAADERTHAERKDVLPLKVAPHTA